MAGWFGPSDTKIFSLRTWQAWLATGMLAAGLAYNRFFFRPESFGLPHWAKPGLGAVLIAGYLILVYFTYDSDA